MLAQPKYQQIADQLRAQIRGGALAPGQRLPSEPDLAAQFDASRNTVRLAIALLTNQGLVVSRQGLGTFVHGPGNRSPRAVEDQGAADRGPCVGRAAGRQPVRR